jgi:hypothetical protein
MLKSLVVIVIAMLARLASLVSRLAILLMLNSLLVFLALMSLLVFLASLMVRPVVRMFIVIAIPAAARVVRFAVISSAGIPAPVPATVISGTRIRASLERDRPRQKQQRSSGQK